MKRVVVTSKNKGKVGAVTAGFEAYAKEQGFTFNVVPVDAESGVSDTPLSDEEGLLGCVNRLTDAKKKSPGANYYVAVEGILARVVDQWFVRGWTMVHDADRGRTVQASGASVPVPSFIGALVSAGSQFSEVTRDAYPVSEAEHGQIRNIGANGVFSDGEYTRDDTFKDGVRICMAYLDNERNWPVES